MSDCFIGLPLMIRRTFCVRGIEQPALRFLILFANDEGYRFAIVQPFMDDGIQKFTREEWLPRDLAQEYSMYDLSL
jgi:hypothetical protein